MTEPIQYLKHTLFAVRGTGGRTTQQIVANLYPEDPLFGNFDQQIAAGVDSTLWDTVDVQYPGDSGLINGLLNMNQTATAGTQILIDLIRNTPGKFALTGSSQGAIICSNIYDELRYGSLQYRRGDFLGGVMMGNPRRQIGLTIPGGTDPGVKRGDPPTHGAMANDLLQDCEPELWWEFANSNDSATDVDDSPRGKAIAGIFEFFYHNYLGEDSIFNQFWQSIGQGIGVTFQEAVGIRQAIIGNLFGLGLDMIKGLLGLTELILDGHIRYFQPYTNLPGNTTASTIDLAVAHFNQVGTANAFAYAVGPSQIWDATRAHRHAEDMVRRKQPLLRIWDGEYHLQHVLGNEYKAQFSFVSNDTGPGQIELPANSPAAKWIHDYTGRLTRGEGRNVHVTVDHCGARWSGIMDKYAIEQRDDGDVVLVMDLMSDYEHLKWYTLWSNPFLPATFQVPRAFILAGPVTWVLKLALFLNILREHNPLISLPDDPLNKVGFFENLDQSNWAVVVKPTSFSEALASGVVWGVLVSRWATWHDAAHTMLEDAELSVRCDRYLEGDPPPWEGAELRPGTLVIDIVDKSGINVGTSTGGNIFSGLKRTVIEFADDFIDSTAQLLADADTPTDYFLPNNRFTDKTKPYVVFQEGDNSAIESSSWFNSPAKGVRVAVGGHSMPGVNEVISASIQAVGDLLGNLVLVGSLGGTIDTLLKPLYEDTILAWWSIKSRDRAQNSGWSRLHEYFQTGSDRAYTITALMVIRAGFWATKTQISWKVQVSDGRPFTIGDRGVGHFFMDDRVGLRLKGDDEIHMDRCRKIDLAWNPDSPPEWQITIGDDRVFMDPAQRAWGKIERLIAGLRDLGVY